MDNARGAAPGRSDDAGSGTPAALDTLDAALIADAPPPHPAAAPASAGERRRRWSSRRRLLVVLVIVLVLLLVAGGVLLAWSLTRTSQSASSTRTYTVSTQTLKQTVAATGTLEPAQQADLSFSSSGTVDDIAVAVGDRVSKGETLARIDDTSLKVAVTTAEAAVSDASSTLASDTDADADAVKIASDEANLKLKKSQLTQARQAVTAATLTAPFSGVVAAVNVSKGDSVSGGSSSSTGGSSSGSAGAAGSNGSGSSGSSGGSSGGGTSSSTSAAITVISRGTFTVDTSVSNADLTSVKRGLQATITPSGSTTSVFGTVATVGVVASSSSGSNSGASSSGSGTFPVTIKVTGTHTDLLPGSSVDVGITVKQLTDAIAVPTAAISSTNGQTTVRKLVNGTATVTDVTLGQSFGQTTQVTKGLSAGDQIEITGFAAARASGNSSAGTRSGQNGGFGGTGGFGGGAGGAPPAGAGPGQAPGQNAGQNAGGR